MSARPSVKCIGRNFILLTRADSRSLNGTCAHKALYGQLSDPTHADVVIDANTT